MRFQSKRERRVPLQLPFTDELSKGQKHQVQQSKYAAYFQHQTALKSTYCLKTSRIFTVSLVNLYLAPWISVNTRVKDARTGPVCARWSHGWDSARRVKPKNACSGTQTLTACMLTTLPLHVLHVSLTAWTLQHVYSW